MSPVIFDGDGSQGLEMVADALGEVGRDLAVAARVALERRKETEALLADPELRATLHGTPDGEARWEQIMRVTEAREGEHRRSEAAIDELEAVRKELVELADRLR